MLEKLKLVLAELELVLRYLELVLGQLELVLFMFNEHEIQENQRARF